MIIISSKPGQLGNRLFVFANLIAFSREHNIPILNPSFDEYCPYFINTQNQLVARYPISSIQSKPSSPYLRKIFYSLIFYSAKIILKLKIKNRFFHAIAIDWGEQLDLNNSNFYTLAKNTKYLFIIGWEYRDFENLKKHTNIVRNFLTPLPSYQKEAIATLEELRKKFNIIIGIHIRQGDYKTFENGKYFFTSEHYATFIKKASLHYADQKIVFLICTNEKQNKQYFKDLNCAWVNGSFIVDLVTLSQCDMIIGPPSTFSMWASFYGQTPLYTLKSIEDPVQLKEATIY